MYIFMYASCIYFACSCVISFFLDVCMYVFRYFYSYIGIYLCCSFFRYFDVPLFSSFVICGSLCMFCLFVSPVRYFALFVYAFMFVFHY